MDAEIQTKHLSPDAPLSKRLLPLAATATLQIAAGSNKTEPHDYIKDMVKKTS
jgi:hypothetical protein